MIGKIAYRSRIGYLSDQVESHSYELHGSYCAHLTPAGQEYRSDEHERQKKKYIFAHLIQQELLRRTPVSFRRTSKAKEKIDVVWYLIHMEYIANAEDQFLTKRAKNTTHYHPT